MRLDDKTREIIKSEVASQLGGEAIVRLFGSRMDDTQRDGDIDLLIEPGSFRRFLVESTGQQSLIGVTRAKTEDAVFVTIQDHHIHKFHRAPRAEFEWCGVAYLSGIRINKDLNFIYEELERHCPLKCCEILCYEIDTPADYHQAMKFFDELSDAASP